MMTMIPALFPLWMMIWLLWLFCFVWDSNCYYYYHHDDVTMMIGVVVVTILQNRDCWNPTNDPTSLFQGCHCWIAIAVVPTARATKRNVVGWETMMMQSFWPRWTWLFHVVVWDYDDVVMTMMKDGGVQNNRGWNAHWYSNNDHPITTTHCCWTTVIEVVP